MGSAPSRQSRLQGCLLGTLLGDSVGLPREGLSPTRAGKLFGDGPLSQRLLFGRGMGSDDTDHACMTAQAYLASPDDAERFARSLAWRLRGWLASLPAGIGFATLRAIIKLWLGFPPRLSGVRSAGNGPSMRAPILGAIFAKDPSRLDAFVRRSSELTHRDEMAVEGALVVARMTAAYVNGEVVSLRELAAPLNTVSLKAAIDSAASALERGLSVEAFAKEQGLERGVTGYTLHTVPVCLYAAARHPDDFRAAAEGVIRCGGDADSTAAIVGGIVGARVGVEGLPRDWLDRVIEWPRTPRWITGLGDRLTAGAQGPAPLFTPLLVVRNLLFIPVVLFHGFRRLFPPY